MYKLVVIDLDNTLLNTEHKISSKNKEVIKMVQNKGTEVLIATGRMYVSAEPYIKELTLKNEAIVYNGAMVKDIKSGQIKYHKPIDKKVARKIIKDVKEQGLHINLYQNDQLYVDQDNEYKKRYEEVSGIKALQVDNLVEFDFNDPTKLLIIEDDPEKHSYYQHYLRDKYGHEIDVTESKHYFIEVGAKGVNKGKTLQQISQDKQIDQQEIIAIGDSYNDIEMISFAGTGIAMNNAAEAVKEKADLIAPHHENDGVAEILDKLILS
ncbi:MAG TPA: HAD family hydrolase [Halanaerobiales bacterium]|nr:HAD family hydrolase [Halanaerobiales bacterium]